MPRTREVDLARLYHLNSSNSRAKMPDFDPGPDRPGQRRLYLGAERVQLPGRDLALARPLGEALADRRSRRDFRQGELPLGTLGRLLHAAFGVKGALQLEGAVVGDRQFPSAGGLHPLELYVAAQRVEGLDDGLYHYDPWAHQLALRRRGALHAELADLALGQEALRDANLFLCLTAIFARTAWKYGQRGYRYVLLEAGHVGQNLHLVATALDLAAVAIGGFLDQEVNRLLDLPAGEEDAIYLACAGLPA